MLEDYSSKKVDDEPRSLEMVDDGPRSLEIDTARLAPQKESKSAGRLVCCKMCCVCVLLLLIGCGVGAFIILTGVDAHDCTEEVLDRQAGELTCRQRADDVMRISNMTTIEARHFVAVEFPEVCGECAQKIVWDGWNKMPMQVKKIDDKFAMEILFSFAAVENNIGVNATHVLFPIGQKVQPTFIKRMNGVDDEEIGIAIQRFAPQAAEFAPVFSEAVTMSIMSKMHGISFRQPLDMTAYDEANSHSSSIFKSDDQAARNYYTTIAAMGARTGMQLMDITGLPNAAVQSWANDGGEVPNVMTEQALLLKEALRVKLAELEDNGTDLTKPMISTVGCIHFEHVAVEADRGVIALPLNEKVATYFGNTVGAPYVAMEMLQGTSFWNFDEVNDRVTLYAGFSLHGYMPDPEADNPLSGSIFVSPEAGAGEPVAYAPKELNGYSKKAWVVDQWRDMRYNKDYTYLFQDPEQLCPEEQKTKIKELLDKVKLQIAQKESGEISRSTLHLTLAETVSEVVPCVTDFVKPDHLNAAEFDFFLATAVAHAIFELPFDMVVSALMARDWNDINASLV